jgi:hypothetical protein
MNIILNRANNIIKAHPSIDPKKVKIRVESTASFDTANLIIEIAILTPMVIITDRIFFYVVSIRVFCTAMLASLLFLIYKVIGWILY